MTDEKELKACCPEGCVEGQACSACPDGVCIKECCPEQCVAAEPKDPLTPEEAFAEAGGKLNYTTVDGEDIPMPYLNDEVEYKWDSPDILFGKATIKMSGMSAEGLHLQCDYLMKLMKETVEMFNERMDFFAKIVFNINGAVSDAMISHTNTNHPKFMEAIVLDQVEKKARFKKKMEDQIAAMTPEQRAQMQAMTESKVNLS